MKCPKCAYDYDRPPMVSAERYDLIVAYIEKHDKCIACTYEELPKNNRPSFEQYIGDIEVKLEAEWRQGEIL